MRAHQDGGNIEWVNRALGEGLDDNLAGLKLVLAGNLLGRHVARARNVAVEVVAVGRAAGYDVEAGLRIGGSVAGVRENDGADAGPGAVEREVRRGVRRGLLRALHDIAVKIQNNHVVRGHPVVRDARGLDYDKAGLRVKPRDIAPGKGYKTVFRELEIGLEHFFF